MAEPNRAEPSIAEPNKADLNELLDKYASDDGFNGTVLIARNGKIIIRKSYGLANVELGVPNNPSLTYRVGSVTKPFTATLTFALIEKGQLRLDGTLGEYLPDLYAGTVVADVTLAQLLSHISGITDVPQRFEDPFYQTTARMTFEPKQYAKEWIKPELVEQPGTRWRYNNNAFLLVGAIISEVTGKSYAANMQEHVFGPAGMTSSGVANKDDVVPGLANGYARDEDENPVKPLYMDPGVFYAAAGIYSTAEDMLRFDQALYGNKIMSEAQRKLMHSPQVPFYAYGWGVGSYDLPDGSKLPVVEHTGSVPGYQSNYVHSERNRDFVFVVSNYWQGSLVQGMGRDLMEVLNGKPPKKIADLLLPALESDGLSAMIAAYEGLGETAADYDLGESAMNKFGYTLVGDKNLAAAITVFEWNVAAYPASANAHDSLGEAYRATGRNAEALASYRRALELDPESESAKTNIAELEAGSK
ncbi:serine hydrolase [Erythrobacter insulae]|nr:serine hydrolase [Erythrobacter insulae]